MAVKVQRAGLRELFDVDLKNLKKLAELLDKFDPKTVRPLADKYGASRRGCHLAADICDSSGDLCASGGGIMRTKTCVGPPPFAASPRGFYE